MIGAAILGLGLIAAVVAGALFVTSGLLPVLHPVKDEDGLKTVQQRLSVAVGDLDAVRAPKTAVAAGAAEVTSCSQDSGEVFEPTLYRKWRLKGRARARPPHYNQITAAGRRAGSSIATALIKRGWSGTARLTRRDVASTTLTKRFDGFTVSLTVDVDEFSVVADGHTQYRQVCRSTE